MASGKIPFFEGLRSFAALQVVLIHSLSLFLPSNPANAFWSDWQQALREVYLFFAVDGTMAVSIFFLLSGYILTLSFDKTLAAPFRNVAKRWVRLQLPIFAAMTFAFLLVTFSGKAHLTAAQLNGSSSWVSIFYSARPDLWPYFVETFFVVLFAGYAESNLFIAFGNDFFSGAQSLNPALWSLNVEFWGSMLIILFAYLRPYRHAYRTALTASVLLFALHPMGLFVIGHVMARCAGRTVTFARWPKKLSRNAIGLLLFLVGVAFSSLRDQLIPIDVFYDLNALTWFKAQSPFHLAGAIAAFYIFAGVAVAPLFHTIFSLRPLVWLGRISFGMYLIHLPILLTIAAHLELVLAPHMGTGQAALCAGAANLALILTLAAAFTKWIDEPAVALSRGVGDVRENLLAVS